jgi:2-polyprenyl-3-methyl-5-hydroxy-6-metoxy-1,4-benzoquinol methylase
MIKRGCPICKEYNGAKMLTRDFSDLATICPIKKYDVTICNHCGSAYAEGIPKQAELDQYYTEMSKYESANNVETTTQSNIFRFERVADFIEQCGVPKDGKILDVGCAAGGLLSVLKNRGYHSLMGLDPSLACAQLALDNYGIGVVSGTIGTQLDPKFDLVILEQVLEHVVEPLAVIEYCSGLLNNNGHIYIGVPDASGFCECSDGPYQQFSLEHINYFTPQAMVNLMHINHFTQKGLTRYIHTVTEKIKESAFMSVWQKNGEMTPVELVRDDQAEDFLLQYIQQSSVIEKKVESVIGKLVASQQEILVWGAGTHTATLLQKTKLKLVPIIAFVDSNPNYQGKSIAGNPIISPERIKEHKNVPILISSLVYQDEIVSYIKKTLQVNNTIVTLYD